MNRMWHPIWKIRLIKKKKKLQKKKIKNLDENEECGTQTKVMPPYIPPGLYTTPSTVHSKAAQADKTAWESAACAEPLYCVQLHFTAACFTDSAASQQIVTQKPFLLPSFSLSLSLSLSLPCSFSSFLDQASGRRMRHNWSPEKEEREKKDELSVLKRQPKPIT